MLYIYFSQEIFLSICTVFVVGEYCSGHRKLLVVFRKTPSTVWKCWNMVCTRQIRGPISKATVNILILIPNYYSCLYDFSLTVITNVVYVVTFAPMVYWIFLSNYFR